jgi:CubicO group peptidase (beta-lactamase class C family)
MSIRSYIYSSCLLLLGLFLSVKSFAQNASQQTNPNEQVLNQIINNAAKQVTNLNAFLVWQHDSIVAEKYFNNCDSSTIFNIKSASKSVLSAIAGAAQLHGYLPSLNTPVLLVLPQYIHNRHKPSVWFANDLQRDDSILNTLTLRHLLTMTTGLDWDDFGPLCQAFVNATDPVQFTLDVPFLEDDAPGQTFNYCSGAAHTFGVALAKLLPCDMWHFADTALFAPAGMKLRRWNTDPLGRYIGGCDMYFSARDMMRFGNLYLKRGILNSHRILSQNWIDSSLAAQTKLNYWDVLPGANGYGYFWWRRISNKHQVYVASGVCGQLICIIPSLDMVIVTACSCGPQNGRAEIKKLHLVIDKLIAATQ